MQVKIRLFKEEGGTYEVHVRPNRPGEGPYALVAGVTSGSVESVVGEEIVKMRSNTRIGRREAARESA